MNNNDRYQEYIAHIRNVVASYETGNECKYADIKKDIEVLDYKINDDQLYLGVVGAFSSGKSTFINSVIHKNLLPTNAVQGTTVAASILKRSDRNDVEIVYTDGSKARLSENQDAIMTKYQVESAPIVQTKMGHWSLWKRFISLIKRIFRFKKSKTHEPKVLSLENCIALFKKITSTEDLATDVNHVVFYYNNDSIPHKIAMVDTPGTESLNKRHNYVTKNAIDNICDAIVIIIPYDEPVSEELLDYIETNLEERKAECIFVVTKIELLGDIDELPRLLRVIKRRLENGLSIENARVFPMPTYIYLKSVDTDMTTTFLNDIDEETRLEFIKMYEEGIEKIGEIIEEKRKDYIRNNIINICERITKRLNDNLTELISDYNNKEKTLRKRLVKPIEEFKNSSKEKLHSVIKMENRRLTTDLSCIQIEFYNWSSSVEQTISECVDSNQVLNRLDMDISIALSNIWKITYQNILKSLAQINSSLKTVAQDFNTTYAVCGINADCVLLDYNEMDFFDEEFLMDCEKMILCRTATVREIIQNDTTGFFKKIKVLFSNPIDKHKNLAIDCLLHITEELIQKVKDKSINEINSLVSEKENMAVCHIENMISQNHSSIEAHTNGTFVALENNSRKRSGTENTIATLEKYINILRGEN